jgi:ABC-2 type transport system permease protein
MSGDTSIETGDEMTTANAWIEIDDVELIGEEPGERAIARRAQWRLVAMEAKLAVREPAGLIFGIGVPVLLLVIFGNIPAFRQPQAAFGYETTLEVYLPVLTAMSLCLFGMITVPIPLATYRQQGVLRRLATTPLSPARLLLAQFAVQTALALTAVVLMLGIGVGVFGLTAPRQAAGFALTIVLGLAGLFAMGLWVSAVARSGKAAQFIGGGLFYPMLFLAGLWWPQQSMPTGLRIASESSPLGALVNAMQSSFNGSFPSGWELLVLAGYTVVFGGLAVRQFSWDS